MPDVISRWPQRCYLFISHLPASLCIHAWPPQVPPNRPLSIMPLNKRSTLIVGMVLWISIVVLEWHRAPVNRFSPPAGDRPLVQSLDTDYVALNLDSIHTYPRPGDNDTTLPSGRVLILTPLMGAASYLDGYFDRLSRVVYPKHLISLGFLVSTTSNDSQQDPTLAALHRHVSSLLTQSAYQRITVIQQTAEPRSFEHSGRHAYKVQESRRKVLAQCRNALLTSALLDESWVLWLDVDVVQYSPTLLRDLMAMDKDIVVPNCFRTESSWLKTKSVPYDRNNWLETTESRAMQRDLEEEQVLFEGYEQHLPTYRQSMADLDTSQARLVPLDGVGGTFTLVKAVVHRSGVNFPVHPVEHAIETEGLAKCARQRGFLVYGAPHLIVQHA